MSASSVRAVTRIAWRGIRRSRGRSALIVLLVLLPVAAMAGAITLITTAAPTLEETTTQRMGVADYAVQPADDDATTDALRALLPVDARIEPWSYDAVQLVLPGRTIDVSARSMDLDGLARGMLVITEGRQPQNQDEVAVDAGVATLASVGIGDTIELEGWGTLLVVGFVEDPFEMRWPMVLLDASVAREMADGKRFGATASWLVSVPGDGLEGTPWIDNFEPCYGCDFSGQSRGFSARFSSTDPSPFVLVVGGLALVEAVLIAAAAFAVGIRRRQRELGLLAAAGGERRHLAGTVLGEGALLGGIAAVGGVTLGVLAIIAASPWLDQVLNRRIGPVEVNAGSLFLAGAIGLLACLLAAGVPARAAARVPVLLALSGRRPPLSPAGRLLVVGVVMIGVAVVMTSVGAAMRLSDSRNMLSIVLMLGGAICGILGFGASGPWLIERLERFGLRLPPSARIALRDTARARSRNGPIVTAILAAFALTVAVSASLASSEAQITADWRPWLRQDSLLLQGEGAAQAGPEAAAALGAIAAAPVSGLDSSYDREVYIEIEDRTAPEDQRSVASVPTVGDGQLLKALGADAAVPALERGELVLLLEQSLLGEPPRDVKSATIAVYDEEGEVNSVTLPATVVPTGLQFTALTDAVMSPATAERIGFSAGPAMEYVIRLPRQVVEADVALAATYAAQHSDTMASAALGPIPADKTLRIVLIIVSLLFALSVTAIAVALGEAESRPDQRTLLAIGADPGIRRRIAAARAGVLALMAGVLAVPAGLLPAWGIVGSFGRSGGQAAAPFVVPIPEVIAAVIILPLAGIIGALLLSRRIPAWSALREAGS